MKNINCISRSITDSPLFRILAVQDKVLKSILIYPIFFTHHAESRVNPPRIAHVRQLLRSAIKTPFWSLPFTEPLRKQLLIKRVYKPCYLKSTYTTEHVGSMGLCVRYASKRSIKITTAQYVICCFLLINPVQSVEKRKAGNCAVRKSRVHFSPNVARERAIRLLKTTDVLNNLLHVDLAELSAKYLILSKPKRIRTA